MDITDWAKWPVQRAALKQESSGDETEKGASCLEIRTETPVPSPPGRLSPCPLWPHSASRWSFHQDDPTHDALASRVTRGGGTVCGIAKSRTRLSDLTLLLTLYRSGDGEKSPVHCMREGAERYVQACGVAGRGDTARSHQEAQTPAIPPAHVKPFLTFHVLPNQRI